MRRSVVAAPLLMMALAVAGCGDKDPQNTSAQTEPTPSESGSVAPSPSITGGAVSEAEFCANMVAVFTGDGSGDPLMDLISDGMPAEMSDEAKAGVQVLIDHAGHLDKPQEMFGFYRDLSSGDRDAVNALGAYVATACGEDLLHGLVALLPSEVPDELRNLKPEDLPSELRGLLPSELPSELYGLIPDDLATLIPEEWRSLIPEEYQGIFESPAPSATPST